MLPYGFTVCTSEPLDTTLSGQPYKHVVPYKSGGQFGLPLPMRRLSFARYCPLQPGGKSHSWLAKLCSCFLLTEVSNQVVLGPSKTSKKGTEAAEGRSVHHVDHTEPWYRDRTCTPFLVCWLSDAAFVQPRIGLICAPCIAAGTALFVSSFLYSLFERGTLCRAGTCTILVELQATEFEQNGPFAAT